MLFKPNLALARQYALSRLAEQLPSFLTYHSLYHTRDDITPAAERLSLYEGISETDFLLLQTAALYHDIGFTIQVENHETISAQIAAEVLPEFGYSPSAIRRICDMILVTKLFTLPKNQLEAILVDADLDVLGRKDFLKRSNDLKKEMRALGKSITDQQWYEQQINFLNIHHYRTISAQALRNARKIENRELLYRLLRSPAIKVETQFVSPQLPQAPLD